MRTTPFPYIAFVAVLFSSVSGQNRLDLKLILDKAQYLEAEPIPCGIELTNISFVQLEAVEPANRVGCDLRLFDEDGRELEYTGEEYSGQWPLYPLKPGEQMFRIEKINQLFGEYISMATAHQVFKRGRYTLRAHYRSGLVDTAFAETTFEVIKPTEEEAKAYERYMKIMWDARGGGDTKTPEQHVAKLEEFEKDFPASVYTPTVLINLNAYYGARLGRKEKALEVKIRLFENYPGAVTIAEGLTDSIVRIKPSKEEKRIFIQMLQNGAKGTLAHRYLRDLAKKRGLE